MASSQLLLEVLQRDQFRRAKLDDLGAAMWSLCCIGALGLERPENGTSRAAVVTLGSMVTASVLNLRARTRRTCRTPL